MNCNIAIALSSRMALFPLESFRIKLLKVDHTSKAPISDTVKLINQGSINTGKFNTFKNSYRGLSTEFLRIGLRELYIMPSTILASTLFGSEKDLKTSLKKTSLIASFDMIFHPLDTVRVRLTSGESLKREIFKDVYKGVLQNGSKTFIQFGIMYSLQKPSEQLVRSFYSNKHDAPLDNTQKAIQTLIIGGATALGLIAPETLKTLNQQKNLHSAAHFRPNTRALLISNSIFGVYATSLLCVRSFLINKSEEFAQGR